MEHLTIDDIHHLEPDASAFGNEVLIVEWRGGGRRRFDSVHWKGWSAIIALEGRISLTLSDRRIGFDRPAAIDALDMHVVSDISLSHDFRGWHILVDNAFLDEAMHGIRRPAVAGFIEHSQCPAIELDRRQAETIAGRIGDLRRDIERRDHIFYREMIECGVRMLAMELIAAAAAKYPAEGADRPLAEELTVRFARLLYEYCREEHGIGFYADALCIDRRYFSRLCKRVSGRTASQWIDEALLREARIVLRDDRCTVQQAADMLHFADQSAFGKFFRRMSGQTPTEYRRSLSAESQKKPSSRSMQA